MRARSAGSRSSRLSTVKPSVGGDHLFRRHAVERDAHRAQHIDGEAPGRGLHGGGGVGEFRLGPQWRQGDRCESTHGGHVFSPWNVCT
jgi:hypothetical protein